MEQFSLIVWCIPCLLFFSFVILITIGKTKYTAKLSLSLASISFIMACGVLIERLTLNTNEYSYYIDWFVIGSMYYRIGYELMNITAWFLVISTAINMLLHIVQLLSAKHDFKNYAFFHFITAALTGVVLSDNMMVYFMLSILISIAIYLFALQENLKDKELVLRKYVYSQMLGYGALLAAIVILYSKIPNHALEFTIIQSMLNGYSEVLSTPYEWLISLLLLLSLLFITGQFIIDKSILNVAVEQQHTLRLCIMLVLKVLLPAYMLLRFDTVLNIVDTFDIVMFLAGFIIMLRSALKQWFLRNIYYSFANVTNSLFGLMLIAFSLKHEVSLIMLASVFALITCFVTILSVTKQTWLSLFLYMISALCLAGIPPLTNFLMLQWLSSAAILHSPWMLIGTSVGITLYSFTLSSFLYISYKNSQQLIKQKSSFIAIQYVIVLPLTLLVVFGLGWAVWTEEWAEWLIHRDAPPLMNFIPSIISLASASIGLILGWQHASKWNDQQYKVWYNMERSLSMKWSELGKAVGDLTVRCMDNLERGWFAFWTIYAPYPWKKTERMMTSRIHSPIFLIAIVWIAAAVVAIILTLLRR